MRDLQRLAVAASIIYMATSLASAAEPTAERASDSVLTTRVKTALAGDDTLPTRDIEVETKDGIVQLSGFVTSEDQRTAALLRARAVQGVTEVRNDLSIRNDSRPAAHPVADTVIAAKGRDSLLDAQLADAKDVNVEVSEGVVQLSGFVNSSQEKARAGDVASAVEGVRDVENQIALTNEREQMQREQMQEE